MQQEFKHFHWSICKKYPIAICQFLFPRLYGLVYYLQGLIVTISSPRCANSVKHFQIGWDGHKYTFGMGKFDCLSEFVEHFENKPLIGGDSGLL